MNPLIQLALGLFVRPTIQRMEQGHANATDHIASAIAEIETVNSLALKHDQKTQSQVAALSNTIATVTGTNAQVQQKAQQLQNLRDAIAQIIP